MKIALENFQIKNHGSDLKAIIVHIFIEVSQIQTLWKILTLSVKNLMLLKSWLHVFTDYRDLNPFFTPVDTEFWTLVHFPLLFKTMIFLCVGCL